MNEPFFRHREWEGGIISVTAPMEEQIYLVKGEDRAALIDTGMGIGSLREYVSGLTDLPLTVINTHGHPDHAGGNGEFEACLMHPDDLPYFHSMCSESFRLGDIRRICPDRLDAWAPALVKDGPPPQPLHDGMELDLGGRVLKAFRVPGHTPGSVCLYDEKTRSLFAGDTLSGQSVWLYGDYSMPLNDYYHALLRLGAAFPDVKQCFVGHRPERLPAAVIGEAQVCARRVLMHDGVGQWVRTFAGEGLQYRCGEFSIIYNPERLY